MTNRLTPFTMVFAPEMANRFSAVTDGLRRDGADPGDRDAFLLNGEAVSLMRELLPDGGLGDAVSHLAALLHHAYLFWLGGSWTFTLDGDTLQQLLRYPSGNGWEGDLPDAYYLQLPRQLVWGRPDPNEPNQPLDGCFVQTHGVAGLRVLGVFGLHPDRMGFAVAEAEGEPVAPGPTDQSGDPFTPQMAGGRNAGLHSVNDAVELLILAGNATSLVARRYPEVKMNQERNIQLA